jgi:hypothetical protein
MFIPLQNSYTTLECEFQEVLEKTFEEKFLVLDFFKYYVPLNRLLLSSVFKRSKFDISVTF